MELSPVVDVSVTVNTVLDGPAGFNASDTAQPVMGNTTTYTSTAVVSSFGRENSGNYSCRASVNSTSPFVRGKKEISGKASITTGNIECILC